MSTHVQTTSTVTHRPDPAAVLRALRRRSFCTLATTSLSGRPHVAGVLYELVEDQLYVNTLRTTRKARNVAETPEVAVCVPVRRLPVGPPSTVHFQARAELLDADASEIRTLVEGGRLRSITGHGELDLPGSCFVRITPARRLLTYGLGMSLFRFVRDPLHAGGKVELGAPGDAAATASVVVRARASAGGRTSK